MTCWIKILFFFTYNLVIFFLYNFYKVYLVYIAYYTVLYAITLRLYAVLYLTNTQSGAYTKINVYIY